MATKKRNSSRRRRTRRGGTGSEKPTREFLWTSEYNPFYRKYMNEEKIRKEMIASEKLLERHNKLVMDLGDKYYKFYSFFRVFLNENMENNEYKKKYESLYEEFYRILYPKLYYKQKPIYRNPFETEMRRHTFDTNEVKEIIKEVEELKSNNDDKHKAFREYISQSFENYTDVLNGFLEYLKDRLKISIEKNKKNGSENISAQERRDQEEKKRKSIPENSTRINNVNDGPPDHTLF
jgi:hypothetical protein